MPGADATDPLVPPGVFFAYFDVPRTESDSNYGRIDLVVDYRFIARTNNPKTMQCFLAVLSACY